MINKDYVCKLGLEFIDEYSFDDAHLFFVFKHNNICVIVDDNICENNKKDDGLNDSGATIYKQDIEISENDIKKLPFDFSFKRQLFGGGIGIRTPGSSHFNGFQDRRIRPLCHSSIFSWSWFNSTMLLYSILF